MTKNDLFVSGWEGLWQEKPTASVNVTRALPLGDERIQPRLTVGETVGEAKIKAEGLKVTIGSTRENVEQVQRSANKIGSLFRGQFWSGMYSETASSKEKRKWNAALTVHFAEARLRAFWRRSSARGREKEGGSGVGDMRGEDGDVFGRVQGRTVSKKVRSGKRTRK
ncbi:hypothetical protein TRVL_07186 [Trypanosoma vivax]|nr:hypothetical protein TRVL_07186 [Trypanosoma vivax]